MAEFVDSCFSIHSGHAHNRARGVGFVVGYDDRYTYLLTCAHVIRDVCIAYHPLPPDPNALYPDKTQYRQHFHQDLSGVRVELVFGETSVEAKRLEWEIQAPDDGTCPEVLDRHDFALIGIELQPDMEALLLSSQLPEQQATVHFVSPSQDSQGFFEYQGRVGPSAHFRRAPGDMLRAFEIEPINYQVTAGDSGGPVMDPSMPGAARLLGMMFKCKGTQGLAIAAPSLLRFLQERDLDHVLRFHSTEPSGPPPFLADRTVPTEHFEEAFAHHRDRTPREPLCVLVFGEDRQRPDLFLDRLEQHTLPELLKVRPQRYNLPWRKLDSLGERCDQLEKDLREALLRHGQAVDSVADALAGQSTMITVTITARDWAKDHLLLAEWLKSVGQYRTKVNCHLLVFAVIQYDDFHWLHLFSHFWQKRHRPHVLRRTLMRATRQDLPAVVALPELAHLKWQHALNWFEKHGADYPPAKRKQIQKKIKALFKGVFRRRSMKAFTEALEDLG